MIPRRSRSRRRWATAWRETPRSFARAAAERRPSRDKAWSRRRSARSSLEGREAFTYSTTWSVGTRFRRLSINIMNQIDKRYGRLLSGPGANAQQRVGLEARAALADPDAQRVVSRVQRLRNVAQHVGAPPRLPAVDLLDADRAGRHEPALPVAQGRADLEGGRRGARRRRLVGQEDQRLGGAGARLEAGPRHEGLVAH